MDDQQPAPLQPAPAGTVTGNQLPPPAAPGTTDPSQFPTAPADAQVASLPPDGSRLPSARTSPRPASPVSGTPACPGQSCKVATPQTKFGAGYRAGPLHCPAPIDGIKSWNVAGKQLTLYDENGGTLARLYSSGGEKFDGQTSNGLPISLTR